MDVKTRELIHKILILAEQLDNRFSTVKNEELKKLVVLRCLYCIETKGEINEAIEELSNWVRRVLGENCGIGIGAEVEELLNIAHDALLYEQDYNLKNFVEDNLDCGSPSLRPICKYLNSLISFGEYDLVHEISKCYAALDGVLVMTHQTADALSNAFCRVGWNPKPFTMPGFQKPRPEPVNGGRDEDETEYYRKFFNHAHLKSSTRFIRSEVWMEGGIHPLSTSFELKNRGSHALGDCLFLDGTPESVYQTLLAFGRVSSSQELGVSLSSFECSYEEFQKHPHGNSWLTEEQYAKLHELAFLHPAVEINADGTAQVAYCRPAECITKPVGKYSVKQSSFKVVSRQLDCKRVVFSAYQTIAEFLQPIESVEESIKYAEENLFERFNALPTHKEDTVKSIVNKSYRILFLPFSFLMIPLVLVVTNLMGILAALPIVSIPVLFVMTILWIGCYLPLWLLSGIMHIMPFTTYVLAPVGVPFAMIGEFVVGLLPDMGERDQKARKVLLFETWPFTHEMSMLNSRGVVSSAAFMDVLKEQMSTPSIEAFYLRRKLVDHTIDGVVKSHNSKVDKMFDTEIDF